jgi:hypothetical protein
MHDLDSTLLQIPAGRRSVLDAYGEVILRGWREAVGPCLAEIETNLIQVCYCVYVRVDGSWTQTQQGTADTTTKR